MVFYCIQEKFFNGLLLFNNVLISKLILLIGWPWDIVMYKSYSYTIISFVSLEAEYATSLWKSPGEGDFHSGSPPVPWTNGHFLGETRCGYCVTQGPLQKTLVRGALIIQSPPGGPRPWAPAAAGALSEAQVLASHPVEWLLLLCLASVTHT